MKLAIDAKRFCGDPRRFDFFPTGKHPGMSEGVLVHITRLILKGRHFKNHIETADIHNGINVILGSSHSRGDFQQQFFFLKPNAGGNVGGCPVDCVKSLILISIGVGLGFV